VQEGRGAERERSGRATELGLRQAMQVGVERREERLPCRPVALLRAGHQRGERVVGWCVHDRRSTRCYMNPHASAPDPFEIQQIVDGGDLSAMRCESSRPTLWMVKPARASCLIRTSRGDS